MKIEFVDILQMRNMAVPRRGKQRLPVPDHGYSTIVQITVSDGKTIRHTGLGEIRALPYLTGESPNGAFMYARRLGKTLINAELPGKLKGRDAARASAALISEKIYEILGVSKDDPLPADRHAAVHFAFDCALLDAMSRAQGVSVAEMLEIDPVPVRRNTFARSFKKPNALLNKLLRGNMPNGWLRGSYDKSGATLATAMAAIAAATSGKEGDLEGVWFDLNGRWKIGDARIMFDGLAGTALLKNSDLALILEQPFPSHASQWYADLFSIVSDSDNPLSGRVRVMIEDDVHTEAGLERMAKMLPQVDLKITPQKCGSISGVLTVLDRARELGFDGHVYLGNAGMNTELNSIVLTTLAQLVGEKVLFSADAKQDSSDIRQVYPQIDRDPEDPCLLTAPDGPGWGTVLCKSGLTKRMRKCDFIRPGEVSPDTESLKALLIMRAFDDSMVDVRQIEDDDEHEYSEDHEEHSDEEHSDEDTDESLSDDHDFESDEEEDNLVERTDT